MASLKQQHNVATKIQEDDDDDDFVAAVEQNNDETDSSALQYHYQNYDNQNATETTNLISNAEDGCSAPFAMEQLQESALLRFQEAPSHRAAVVQESMARLVEMILVDLDNNRNQDGNNNHVENNNDDNNHDDDDDDRDDASSSNSSSSGSIPDLYDSDDESLPGLIPRDPFFFFGPLGINRNVHWTNVSINPSLHLPSQPRLYLETVDSFPTLQPTISRAAMALPPNYYLGDSDDDDDDDDTDNSDDDDDENSLQLPPPAIPMFRPWYARYEMHDLIVRVLLGHHAAHHRQEAVGETAAVHDNNNNDNNDDDANDESGATTSAD